MTPRNLRKPTQRRVSAWWSDWCRSWGTLGRVAYNEAWWATRDNLDEVEAREVGARNDEVE